jgi:sulfatase maturation enzyme AslB (radical SAM superfamily)
LNPDFVIDIIKEFQEVDNITFHIYTNGYNRKRIEKILDAVNIKKLHMQVSFDGVDISNKFRITHSGRGSSATVLENLEHLVKRGVSISMKSTLPLQSMENLHKSWLDFEKLNKKFEQYDNIRIAYAPTIDYVSDLPDQILPDTIAIFRSEMLKVAKEEIRFFREKGYFLCSWFGAGDAKTNCSAGANMHGINVDEQGYACHGAFYSPNKDELTSGSINDDDFIKNIQIMSDKYSKELTRFAPACQDCVATTCMICPVSSYDLSKNDDPMERWHDRWVNNMCGFFKAFGEIDRTVQKYVQTREVGNIAQTEVNLSELRR